MLCWRVSDRYITHFKFSQKTFRLSKYLSSIISSFSIEITKDSEFQIVEAVFSLDSFGEMWFPFFLVTTGWSKWSDWGECSAPCDDGMTELKQTRNRTCIQEPCPGNATQSCLCNLHIKCPGRSLLLSSMLYLKSILIYRDSIFLQEFDILKGPIL